MKKIDILIVGQGLAGSVLSYLAQKRGLSIMVIDIPLSGRASYVAGGMFNPVTGRRVKKSWNYDIFYSKMVETYQELDILLGIKAFHLTPIHRLLSTVEDVNNWEIQRLEDDYHSYMGQSVKVDDERLIQHEGVGILNKGGWLDMVKFLSAFRVFLQENQQLVEEKFDYSQLRNNQYKDLFFDKIIFCEGYRVMENPFFSDIQLWSTKGETITIELEGEDFDFILNKNMLIVPLGNGKYKVGATLERNIDIDITSHGLEELKEKVESVIKVPFRVIDQEAGIRPNVRDRKPLIGVSKEIDNYYIFNGLGSKGVSLAPYFAEHLLSFIYEGKELQKDVNWQRIFK
ncbi:MAG: FAD-binding oxidoreductase [Chitinophagales bacterium]|nr:FAD-binding oxidoreductase [Chitinophagales bacterium]MCZ2394882.1 FAD-binding oxidoreductase [Chitinophagales bacterium]